MQSSAKVSSRGREELINIEKPALNFWNPFEARVNSTKTVTDIILLYVQVNLGETLLEAEASESVETPVNCFRKLFGE